MTLNYSALVQDLASHGYVVVGFDVPYRTWATVFPDGRVFYRTADNDADLVHGVRQQELLQKLLSAWTADAQFVVDQLEVLNRSATHTGFAGRLDLDRLGIFGHSLGGAVAAHFCNVDNRCKAGINIDGKLLGTVVQDGLKVPFLFLLSDHTRESDAETAQIKRDVRSVGERLPNDPNTLMLTGAYHFGFSDDGALMKSPLLRRLLQGVGVIGLDGRRQLDLTSECVHRFFDVHLKNQPDTTPCGPGTLVCFHAGQWRAVKQDHVAHRIWRRPAGH